MTKTVEEVRRAAFEAHMDRVMPPAFGWFERNEDGDYILDFTRNHWATFNAALDAVEIQLPERDAKGGGSPDSEMGASLEQYEAVAYNFALAGCRAAIEQTGLGLRVK